ncbi:MAG: type III-D CRISPR-associated protein Csx19 [Gammaproteobacteria bacterium]
MTTLHTESRDRITLAQALTAFADRKNMTALIYLPMWCGLVRWNGTALETSREPVDVTQVFEARLFDDSLEMRWLREPSGDGTGYAVCVSEGALALEDWALLPPRTDLHPVDGGYLLTGQGCGSDGLPDGWSRLSSAAIGCIAAPIGGILAGGRVTLRYREYLGRADGPAGEDGNWAVLEERLLNLVLAEEKT